MTVGQSSGAEPSATIQGVDFSVDLQRIFCESSAKEVAKEKVSMEASSPHSTSAAASQGNVVNNENSAISW